MDAKILNENQIFRKTLRDILFKVLLIVFFVLGIYKVLNFSWHSFGMSMGIFLIIVLTLLLNSIKNISTNSTKFFLSGSTLLWLIILTLSNPFNGAGNVLVFIYPAMVFFLHGKKRGLYWTSIFSFLLVFILILKEVLIGNSAFDIPVLVFAVAALFMESIILYQMAKMQEETKDALKIELTENTRFRLGIESALNHLVITDKEGKILFANKAAQESTGYSHDEMIGQTPRLWGGAMDPAVYEEMWKTIKEDRKPYKAELQNRRKNGEIYTAVAIISPILGAHNELFGFIGSEEDITERVELEKQLRERVEQAEKNRVQDEVLLQNIGDAVLMVDSSGKIVKLNQVAIEMLGFSKEEMIGQFYVDIVQAKDLDGKKVEAQNRSIQKALKSNKAETVKYIYRRKDGAEFIADIINTPISIGDKIIGLVTVFRDVTKEQQIDKAKTEFVSLASHQLRTPLSAINWYTEMLLAGDVGKINKEQKNYLEEVYQGNQRMIELVNSLLDVSRIDMGSFVLEPEEMNVVDIIKSVGDEQKHSIELKNIHYKEDIKKLPNINADPRLIRVVFQNLISNAIKYTPKDGKVKVIAKFNEGQKTIGVDIEDNGFGIPADQKAKIFTKLFRATNVQKMDVEGNGLGLYIVKSIIEQSGGKISFESKEGKGTKFYVELPVGNTKPRKTQTK